MSQKLWLCSEFIQGQHSCFCFFFKASSCDDDHWTGLRRHGYHGNGMWPGAFWANVTLSLNDPELFQNTIRSSFTFLRLKRQERRGELNLLKTAAIHACSWVWGGSARWELPLYSHKVLELWAISVLRCRGIWRRGALWKSDLPSWSIQCSFVSLFIVHVQLFLWCIFFFYYQMQ